MRNAIVVLLNLPAAVLLSCAPWYSSTGVGLMPGEAGLRWFTLFICASAMSLTSVIFVVKR